MDGCTISAEGITRDREALHEAGLGGVLVFSLADTTTPWAGKIGKSPTPGIIAWAEPWWKLVRHAVEECRRLGMESNGAGCETSGGPWVAGTLNAGTLFCEDQPRRRHARAHCSRTAAASVRAALRGEERRILSGRPWVKMLEDAQLAWNSVSLGRRMLQERLRRRWAIPRRTAVGMRDLSALLIAPTGVSTAFAQKALSNYGTRQHGLLDMKRDDIAHNDSERV